MAFEKSVLSIVAYGLLSHLRYLYRFYHSRAARAWSFCNEMYHNVFWYECLTFQTQIYLHKQYIFDTNIIQSEYALLFPFSIFPLQRCCNGLKTISNKRPKDPLSLTRVQWVLLLPYLWNQFKSKQEAQRPYIGPKSIISNLAMFFIGWKLHKINSNNFTAQ